MNEVHPTTPKKGQKTPPIGLPIPIHGSTAPESKGKGKKKGTVVDKGAKGKFFYGYSEEFTQQREPKGKSKGW